MNSAATDTNQASPPAGPSQANRSQVLTLFRANPFRVLRVRPDVSVDEAIWKSEEALTRLRAGLSLPDGELLPWMADPDEPEIRQAVQRIEEPLRRLTDQVFWFDPGCDSDGELLRHVLAGLDPGLLNDYLSREPDAAEVPRLLNHANLRLLLAALGLYDALPDGFRLPAPEGEAENAAELIPWRWSRGLETSANPHELDLTNGLHARRARRVVSLWSDALACWLRLLKAPVFLAFVQSSIARLEDDVVGADDAEVIINSVLTRLTDLLVGEVKAQFLAGRIDRVRSLLEAAEASDVEPRRWAQAFRPLRPLFRTEVAELERLLGGDDPGVNDSALYLSRLKTLRARWATLDRASVLGLDEIGDEAVVKGCEALNALESHSAVDQLKPLYGEALGLASAESLKQRIATAVTRLNGFEHYTCHFCRSREMDLQRSVVITGKLESHGTYGYNSTTIHYNIKANIIPRCSRCSDLHLYLWQFADTIRGTLGVALAAGIIFMLGTNALGADTEPVFYFVLAGISALMLWPAGIVARWVATVFATPRGERRYWRASNAKQYKEMQSEGCTMTIDYRQNAFQLLKAAQER